MTGTEDSGVKLNDIKLDEKFKKQRNKQKSMEKIYLQSQLTKLQETIIDKKMCFTLFHNEAFV